MRVIEEDALPYRPQRHQVRHIPVQQNERVVGIVSKRDVHHLFDRLLPAIDSSD